MCYRHSAGQALGLVGLSGHTEFPHLHLSLRRGDVELDPLTGRALNSIGVCGPNAATPGAHWSPAARAALSYRGALWFEAGFTGAAPTPEANIEEAPASASRTAPALVFWALASGPRAGDMLRIRLFGPDGALIADSTRAQPRDQAQASLYAGRRAPAGGWAPGAYRGEAAIERGGRVIAMRSEAINLN